MCNFTCAIKRVKFSEERGERKEQQTPNLKIQTNSRLQLSNSNSRGIPQHFCEVWNLELIWDLNFGFWNFPAGSLPPRPSRASRTPAHSTTPSSAIPLLS